MTQTERLDLMNSTRIHRGIGYAPSWHRPFLRYLDGEQGGGAGDQTPEGTGGENPPEPAGDGNQENPPQGEPSENPRPLEEQTPEDLVKIIKDLRRENASRRDQNRTAKTEAQQAEELSRQVLQSVTQALGLGAGEEPKPEELQSKLTEALAVGQEKDNTIADLQRRVAVRDLAEDAKVDVKRLFNQVSFIDAVKSVDPTNAQQLKDAIADAVKSDPSLSTIPSSSGSGGGHQGNGAPRKPSSLQDAVAASIARQSQ